MPPPHRCICQNEDPNSPYPPGSDGCVVRPRPQPRPLSEPVTLQAMTTAVALDRSYIPAIERSIRTDARRRAGGSRQGDVIGGQQLAIEAHAGVPSASEAIRDLFPTEVEN